MRGRDDEPRPLGDILDGIARRLKRVDLRTVDEARALWARVADPVLATHCHVEMIKDGVLVVIAPSGAFAQRVAQDAEAILEGYAVLGRGAPTSVRAVVRAPTSRPPNGPADAPLEGP